MYLEEIAEASPEDQQFLLSRRSPWLVRAKLVLLSRASRLRTGIHSSRKFTLQPGLPPLS